MAGLGCEVGSAKGSEVKLTRRSPHARVAVLGRHKPNCEIYPIQIQRALRQLDLPVDAFVTAVRG